MSLKRFTSMLQRHSGVSVAVCIAFLCTTTPSISTTPTLLYNNLSLTPPSTSPLHPVAQRDRPPCINSVPRLPTAQPPKAGKPAAPTSLAKRRRAHDPSLPKWLLQDPERTLRSHLPGALFVCGVGSRDAVTAVTVSRVK